MLGSTARDMDSISQIESPKQKKNQKTREKWQHIASQSNPANWTVRGRMYAIDLVTSELSWKCSNALPVNLVHFPKGEYPGKLTQRNNIRRGIIRAFRLSKRIATRSHIIAKDDSFNAQPIRKSRVTEQLS